MNKTKRKIFETSMKLFAEKGYDATSIEEITAKVGVAKGTLYYHFSSKEEIFNFLIEEGMNLLKNSINLKVHSKNFVFHSSIHTPSRHFMYALASSVCIFRSFYITKKALTYINT